MSECASTSPLGTKTSSHTCEPGTTRTAPPPLRRRTSSIPAAASLSPLKSDAGCALPMTTAGASGVQTQARRAPSGSGRAPWRAPAAARRSTTRQDLPRAGTSRVIRGRLRGRARARRKEPTRQGPRRSPPATTGASGAPAASSRDESPPRPTACPLCGCCSVGSRPRRCPSCACRPGCGARRDRCSRPGRRSTGSGDRPGRTPNGGSPRHAGLVRDPDIVDEPDDRRLGEPGPGRVEMVARTVHQNGFVGQHEDEGPPARPQPRAARKSAFSTSARPTISAFLWSSSSRASRHQAEATATTRGGVTSGTSPEKQRRLRAEGGRRGPRTRSPSGTPATLARGQVPAASDATTRAAPGLSPRRPRPATKKAGGPLATPP